MKVRMLATITGTRNGEDWPPLGGTVDLPDAEAADMIAGGLAEPAKAVKVETASVEAPEDATMPKPRARKAGLTTKNAP